MALLLTAGCNGKKDGTSGDKTDGQVKQDGSTPSGEKKPLAIKARGTLSGKVTLSGMPNVEKMNKDLQALMEKHKDAIHCMAGTADEKSQQAWRVGEGNGLADVFVWVKPPDGQFFKLEKEDLELKETKAGEVDIKAKEIVLDQPHCAFLPHAFAVFPAYYDGKAEKPTGQKVIVANSAKMPHNTKWAGGPRNRGGNVTIRNAMEGEPVQRVELSPALRPDDAPVNFQCDMHPWMTATSRVFDHPFVAVTDKNGNYEIKGVPAGVELQVIAWHPEAKFLNTAKGEAIKIDEGKTTTKNFEAKAK
jgi:hypothetical protein